MQKAISTKDRNYSVYAVIFDNGRIKIGISHSPKSRMKYYAQELRRNFGEYFTWFACKPFDNKRDALATEGAICKWLKEFSIPGHREWFAGATPKEFTLIIGQIDRFRMELASEPEEEKRSIPWQGLHGHFKNEVTA